MMWEHPHEGWLFRAMSFGGKTVRCGSTLMRERWLFRAMSIGEKQYDVGAPSRVVDI